MFAKIIGAVALLAVAGWGLFGFLASYELSKSERWPWQAGFSVLILSCLIGVVMLLRTRKSAV